MVKIKNKAAALKFSAELKNSLAHQFQFGKKYPNGKSDGYVTLVYDPKLGTFSAYALGIGWEDFYMSGMDVVQFMNYIWKNRKWINK